MKVITHIYNEAGIVVRQGYFEDGFLSRPSNDGPARILRDPLTGNVIYEAFYMNGHLHREPKDGPASILRSPLNGKILQAAYWIYGSAVEPSFE